MPIKEPHALKRLRKSLSRRSLAEEFKRNQRAGTRDSEDFEKELKAFGEFMSGKAGGGGGGGGRRRREKKGGISLEMRYRNLEPKHSFQFDEKDVKKVPSTSSLGRVVETSMVDANVNSNVEEEDDNLTSSSSHSKAPLDAVSSIRAHLLYRTHLPNPATSLPHAIPNNPTAFLHYPHLSDPLSFLIDITQVPCEAKRAFHVLSDPEMCPAWDSTCLEVEHVESEAGGRIIRSFSRHPEWVGVDPPPTGGWQGNSEAGGHHASLMKRGAECELVGFVHAHWGPAEGDGDPEGTDIGTWVMTSVEDARYPPVEGVPRWELALSGMTIAPSPNNPQTSRIKYLVQFRKPKDCMPTSLAMKRQAISNLVTFCVPENVRRLIDILRASSLTLVETPPLGPQPPLVRSFSDFKLDRLDSTAMAAVSSDVNSPGSTPRGFSMAAPFQPRRPSLASSGTTLQIPTPIISPLSTPKAGIRGALSPSSPSAKFGWNPIKRWRRGSEQMHRIDVAEKGRQGHSNSKGFFPNPLSPMVERSSAIGDDDVVGRHSLDSPVRRQIPPSPYNLAVAPSSIPVSTGARSPGGGDVKNHKRTVSAPAPAMPVLEVPAEPVPVIPDIFKIPPPRSSSFSGDGKGAVGTRAVLAAIAAANSGASSGGDSVKREGDAGVGAVVGGSGKVDGMKVDPGESLEESLIREFESRIREVSSPTLQPSFDVPVEGDGSGGGGDGEFVVSPELLEPAVAMEVTGLGVNLIAPCDGDDDANAILMFPELMGAGGEEDVLGIVMNAGIRNL
ncbi:hypothetical protein HDU97_003821 [Phlyctochytrium planicorne]|nr:hypothetical protein HDU97_003821 [Phlyctochytrium planicorne]